MAARLLFRNLSSSVIKSARYNLSNKMALRTVSTQKRETFETIQEISDRLIKKMGVELGYKSVPVSRAHLTKYLSKSQNELPPRSMNDSYLVALIPLSSNRELQDKYITFLGHVRVGRLLEDMDIFAVMVAHKHILNPNLPEGIPTPQTLVTALVDRIDFSDFTPIPQEDIKMSGHVSWVGQSSMEVVVWLEQQNHGTWHRITRALFLIAARDPTNTRSAVVNPLNPANEREKGILSGGEARKRNRKLLERIHLSKVIPNDEEQRIIHDLYMKTKLDNDMNLRNVVLPSGAVWMEDWTLSNTIFSQPENRNLHNTVFGGFIMRQAAELSWVLGYKFSKYRPVFKSISDINFKKPIAVNSLIHMHAFIVFTQIQFMQITVYVEALDPNTGKSDTTNTVHFTYQVPEVVKEVYPKTYHEAMMYIDGRRHFLEVMQTEPGVSNNLPDPEFGSDHKSKL